MYKIINGDTPDNLSSLLPNHVKMSTYNLKKQLKYTVYDHVLSKPLSTLQP